MGINGPCVLEGCDAPRKYKLHCERHYRQAKRGVEQTLANGRFVGCKIDGCDGPRKHQGMCRPHWRAAGGNRKDNLKRNYGITVEQYDEMVMLQCGLCAICGNECSLGRRLAVDHCHATGKIRGLLCYTCNTTLGKFEDSPQRFRDAADYLERG